MSKAYDFILLGGGISGLLTARELSQDGHRVAIIDIGEIGRESSWAGGGILLPLYPWRQAPCISELVMASLEIYPGLVEELLTQTGIDPEFVVSGLLVCKNPDLDRALDWCHRHHIRQQPASHEQFPQIQSRFDNPLWLPDIAQARNPRLLTALKTFLEQQGVTFFDHCQIDNIEYHHHKISRLTAGQQVFDCGHLIITAGAWTSRLFQTLLPAMSPPPEIKPVKGQMLLFETKPNLLPCMVLDNDRYLIPRRDGKILAGSTVEDAGFDKQTSETSKQQLSEFATSLLPPLKNASITHHWAGLRPGSAEGIPCIGKHPEIDNLSVNAGHFRNGLGMGPASARLLADLILGREPLLNPEPFQFTSKPS
jgi:glycine oxidase